MKDRHAVTTQWLSLPAGCRPVGEWQLPEGLEVLDSTLHTHKLRTGQLRGNRFRITLTANAPEALERARNICDRLVEGGLPNYFGPQRFGYQGQNLPNALAWLERGAVTRGKSGRFYAKLFPSVIQAEIFNRYLSARLRLGSDRLIEGEVVRLQNTGSVFVVEDPAAELSRLQSRDIYLTGPMLGPKAKLSRGPARELEDVAVREIGITRQLVESWGRLAAGTFRDLLVYPEGLRLDPAASGMLCLEFFLPAGSYASVLVRELSRSPAAP
jgi:tRNA pseudouridine13 synthase